MQVNLLVIRHAIAEERDDFAKSGQEDFFRPLTNEGRSKMQRIAKQLTKLQSEIDVIWSSPLTRAKQTTEILQAHYKNTDVLFKKELEPEKSPDKLTRELQDYANHFQQNGLKTLNIALIGHEPHLSRFISWVLLREPTSFIRIKKAGMVKIRTNVTLDKNNGEIIWALGPKQLLSC